MIDRREDEPAVTRSILPEDVRLRYMVSSTASLDV
jgi:hypothetical protein